LSASRTAVSRPVIRGVRWWIIGLVFLATVLNFVNRLAIAILGPVITRQFHLSNQQFASITTWFLVAYTVSQGLSGRLYDRIGTRLGFTISTLTWSVASMAHAFVTSLLGLSCLRFIMGLGEAGNWPGAAKVVTEWFPVRQRALGMAIFNSGTSIASVIAPPLIIWLQSRFGWQATFLAAGASGLVWLIAWLGWYQPPDRHARVSAEELELIRSGSGPAALAQRVSYAELILQRPVWAIVVSRFFADPVWWLYITWLPLYLYTVRGFSLHEIGMFTWAPYAAADLGSLAGGWLSGHLIDRGWSVNRARKTVIFGASILMTVGVLAASAKSATTALILIGMVLFGFQAWINNVQTLPSDYFPENAVGAVAGMGGVGAGIGAILLVQTTGWVVDRWHSYTPILLVTGVLPLVATGFLFALGGRVRRVDLAQSRANPIT